MTKQITFKNWNDEEITVKVGDHVGFKSDVEQSAEVTGFRRVNTVSGRQTWEIIVKAPADGFQGAYISGCRTTTVELDQIF